MDITKKRSYKRSVKRSFVDTDFPVIKSKRRKKKKNRKTPKLEMLH